MAVWKPFSLLVAVVLAVLLSLTPAVFAQSTYSLTVNVTPLDGGTVKADCDTPCRYVSGSWAHLLALPGSGYVFTTWDGDLACMDGGSNFNPNPSLGEKRDTSRFLKAV